MNKSFRKVLSDECRRQVFPNTKTLATCSAFSADWKTRVTPIQPWWIMGGPPENIWDDCNVLILDFVIFGLTVEEDGA